MQASVHPCLEDAHHHRAQDHVDEKLHQEVDSDESQEDIGHQANGLHAVLCRPAGSQLQEKGLKDRHSTQAEEAGIIQKGRYDYFVLYKTPALSLPNHQPEDFLEDCVFQRTLLDDARNQLVNQLNDFCNHTLAVEEVPLRNDGDPQLGDMGTAQVRLDYFLRFPVLQQIAREELDKLHSLQDAIQRLDRIQADLTRSG